MSENNLNPAVVVPIFSATGVLFFVALGCFAHRRPTNSFVCWLDSNYIELLVVSFLVTLVMILIVVPFAPSDAQAILPSCFITWVLFVAFAIFRYRHSDLDELLDMDLQKPQEKQRQPESKSNNVVILIVSEPVKQRPVELTTVTEASEGEEEADSGDSTEGVEDGSELECY